jgi:hypothetical protein
MIALVLTAGIGLSVAAQSQTTDTVFACQYFRTEREASDGDVHVVDLRAVRHADATWTLEWADKPPVSAISFPSEFGSVGGSVGLRWRDVKGKEMKAYISFSDIGNDNGKQYFWLNLKRPSLWQPPGFGCESQGTSK